MVKYFIKRAAAYLIDCLICYSFIMLLIQWVILSNIREFIGISDVWFENSLNLQLYVLTTISLPVWFYFTYFDSNRASGTLGKRLVKLSVENKNNERIGFNISFLRTILKLSPWEIAHVGIIFPVPIYFAVNPGVRVLTVIGIILFVVFIISILVNPDRKSLYDKHLDTRVIEK